MRIRPYTPADLDELRHLHAAQGFGYPFPDLESPLFVTKLVLEEDESGENFRVPSPTDITGSQGGRELMNPGEGVRREEASVNSPSGSEYRKYSLKAQDACARAPHILMAAFLRLTAETYLLHDPNAGTPRQRWQNVIALHEAARRDAAARGLDDVQAFLPPRIARAFGRRLARLGWRQDPWPCFTRTTGLP